MARTVGIGIQSFSDMIERNCFYIDKTDFIRQWWENQDAVTLITRPRRFGKTLMMDMLRCFFSVDCADQREIFQNLSIWNHKKYRDLQGQYPVIFLSMANVKETSYENARRKICQLLTDLYSRFFFLLDSKELTPKDREFFSCVSADMGDVEATLALGQLSKFLFLYYKKKVIILLDEYDTPVQEAYINGYWKELAEFVRGMFNGCSAYSKRNRQKTDQSLWICISGKTGFDPGRLDMTPYQI